MSQKLYFKHERDYIPRHKPFDYQHEAYEEVKDLEYSAIFHEQGLGKTKIAIDIALYWLREKQIDTVIFVTKKTLVKNWENELLEHASIQASILSQDKKSNHQAFHSTSRVYVSYYEAIHSNLELIKDFCEIRNVALILDESQKIKNPNSKISHSFFDLSGSLKKRIIMTGTPIANRPFDIWSQIYFLDEGATLGDDFDEFKRGLDLPKRIDTDDQYISEFKDNLSRIFDSIEDFTVRETKSGGRIKLPKKEYLEWEADWEEQQYILYCKYTSDLRVLVKRDQEYLIDNAEGILKRLLRLVQVASNPALVDNSYSRQPGKIVILKRIVEDAISKNEKLIIWTNFVDNIRWLENEIFADKHIVKIYGKMDMESRNMAVEKFKTQEKVKILIATPASAKEGLTLTNANHVVFFDRGFSLDDYLQSQDRIHRISQKRTCYVHNIIMRSSIDEWVDDLLYAKKLSAAYGQGDISREVFEKEMNFDYISSLKAILDEAG